MASIQQRKGRSKPWEVRYKDGIKHRSRSFTRKGEAKAFLAHVDVQMLNGDFISPEHGKVNFAEWCKTWLGSHHVSENTKKKYESAINAWVEPHLGDRLLGSIRPIDVSNLVTKASSKRSSATAVNVYRVVKMALDSAVANRLIRENPCDKVSQPTEKREGDVRPLSDDEFKSLSVAMDWRYTRMLDVTVALGLRWGEAAALSRDDFDLGKRTVTLSKSLTRSGVVKGTKTDSKTLLPLPESLLGADFRLWLIDKAPIKGPLWVSPMRKPLRYDNFRERFWNPAVEEAMGEPIGFHALRHTTAARLISSGAHVKQVQAWMRHASSRITLDTYGHFFESDLGECARLL